MARKAIKKTNATRAKARAKTRAKTRRPRAAPQRGAAQPAAPAGNARTIHIRMYNCGFGDCFLIRAPTRSGAEKTILIDCGSFKKQAKSISEIVGQVIADLPVRDGKPRVDLLIATHRHKDHIAGFADPRWSEVEVGEVWMPWTESEEPEAISLRSAQTRLALALAGLEGQPTPGLERSEVLELNAGVNVRAMETLQRGFAGHAKRRYLPEKDATTRVVACASLPEVMIHVLGPSRDPDTIFDMNPPSTESFLALLGMSHSVEIRQWEIPEPFGIDWVDDRKTSSLFDEKPSLDKETRERLERIHDGLETKLAIALDNALNNTSLMLMLVIGKAHLLFPGDAQWGTWRELMDNDAACELLRNTTFYKVGHHGSHNATPASFVEKYLGTDGGDTWAMVPVTPYGKWPEIPRKPLLDKIKERTKYFVRSDQRGTAPGFTRRGDWYVEAAIPAD
jgi:beta-lactamase superfamily II metal-dependent hydrolase